MPEIPRRIVDEVSKTWIQRAETTPKTLSERFERVIAVNADRGFELESWKLDRVYNESALELTMGKASLVVHALTKA